MSRITGLAIAALALLVLLAWLLQPRLTALLGENDLPVLWQAEADEACDLHSRPCRIELDGGRWIELALEPGPIRTLRPFTITVRQQGIDAETVAVDFSGVEMTMGYNRPKLARIEPGVFSGDGLLPMCVLERMTWRTQVLMDSAKGRGVAVFHFETTRE
jgi:hypothetical protein